MTKLRQAISRSRRLSAFGALGLATGLGLSSGASAQSAFDRSRNVGVLDRPHPEYDAAGLRVGTFLVYPKTDISIGYDDNVFAAETGAVNDTVFGFRPQVSVESNWSRHSLQLTGQANVQKYADLEDENTTQYRAVATGRLDIQRDSNVSGVISYSSAIEPRGSSGYTTVTQSPIEYDTFTTSLAAVREFNRLKLSGRAGLSTLDYQDGVSFTSLAVDQDFRDNTSSSASVRLDYALSPQTALFGEVGAVKLDFDAAPGVLNRDSDGGSVLVGVNFEVSNLVTGEVSAGYITRAFDDGVTEDVDRFAYRAALTYFPTELLTVRLTGATTVNESGVVTTPAYVANSVGLRADYEVLRNLIVSGIVDYSNDEYQDIDRTDDRYGAGLTATYLLSRRAGVSLTYSQLTQDSSGAARNVDYTERSLTLALVLQL